MRPRGNPPTPSARSSAIDPLGTISNAMRSWKSPIRMIEPLPNCRSICASAFVKATCRSSSVAIGVPFLGSSTITLSCRSAKCLALIVEDRLDELVWDEGAQIVGALADADELDRHLQLVDDRYEHPALGRRVELGHDDPRELRRRVEELGLRDRVLPVRAVNDEQRLSRRLPELALDHSTDLLELFHQIGLRLESPGGVDEHDVGAAGLRGTDAVEDHRCRIGAVGTAN